MQRKSSSSHHESDSQNIMAVILQSLPSEAGLTKIEYEGPRIALYSKNPRYLMQNTQVVSNMVNTIKKRIVIRTDESIRRSEEESIEILNKIIPKELGITETFFDPALGESILFAKNPLLLSHMSEDFDNIDLVEQTGWEIKIRKAPQRMSVIRIINDILHNTVAERIRFYKETGEKIFRPKLDEIAEVSLTALGGFAEIGRSSLLLSTHESKILLDCGIKVPCKDSVNSIPRFDITGVKMNQIDAIVLSHAHFDHTGFLPALIKYGYKGPIYCSEPTLPLMNLLHERYLVDAGDAALYSEKDIIDVVTHTIPLTFGIVTDISPDIKLVLSNSGHILGSASIHLHIGNGDHNLVYTGDLKFGRTLLLENASWNFPRVETMNMYMEAGKINETNIFVEKVISDIASLHEVYPEYLSREIRHRILEGKQNTLQSEKFVAIDSKTLKNEPAIILAHSSMLIGGSSVEYLKQISQDTESRLILASYQAPGTPGRLIQDGGRQILIDGYHLNINCQVEKIEGFNTHSDYNQLLAYISRLRPKLRRILVNHGERDK